MLLIVPLLLIVQMQAESTPVDARHLAFSAPVRIVQFSVEEIKGEPYRLCWSPDGARIYLRAVKTDRWGNQKVFHYEVMVGERRLRPIEREPEWAPRYWEWKSALSAPALPDFRITVESREERKSAAGIVNAGAIAQSGGDPNLGAELGPQGQAIAKHLMQDQMVTTTTLTLRRERLAEFVNEPAVPGLTFGWAPARMNAIAFADAKGRLVVMDGAGLTCRVPGVAGVSLPAWSASGTQLAFVQRVVRGMAAVAVVTVSGK